MNLKPTLSLLSIFGSFALAPAWAVQEFQPLELEITSEQYESLLSKQLSYMGKGGRFNEKLASVIQLGKRNLDWLLFINANRSPDKRLSFSSRERQAAYPMDQPRVSNVSIILSLLEELKGKLPEPMRAVLFEGGEFTAEPGVSDQDYVSWGYHLDSIYQRASRWILQEPWLSRYRGLKRNDIRGYNFLGKIPDLESKLSTWNRLDSATQIQYKIWLTQVCFNSRSRTETQCKQELQSAIEAKKSAIFEMYQKYLPASKKIYESFFVLENPRRDIAWKASQKNVMEVPFEIPQSTDLSSSEEVKAFLKNNLEEEWRFGKWQLSLGFTPDMGHPHVVFEPGVTPHVNGLGGSRITMDANQPLSEYNVQWTIRHEFGHVLGFPDCYIEFYDESQGAMLNYQIDITNIMCSRRGHLQEIHFNELKKAYYGR